MLSLYRTIDLSLARNCKQCSEKFAECHRPEPSELMQSLRTLSLLAAASRLTSAKIRSKGFDDDCRRAIRSAKLKYSIPQ